MSDGQMLLAYGLVLSVTLAGGFLVMWRVDGLRHAFEVAGIVLAIFAGAFGLAALAVWLAQVVIP